MLLKDAIANLEWAGEPPAYTTDNLDPEVQAYARGLRAAFEEIVAHLKWLDTLSLSEGEKNG